MSSLSKESSRSRPIVFNYSDPREFLVDLFEHYKSTRRFSLRQRTSLVGECSQTLVSQILKGTRRINRENFPSLALVFQLTDIELDFLEEKLRMKAGKMSSLKENLDSRPPLRPKNHLLSHWLHPYVKDLVHLKSFKAKKEVLAELLKGLASSAQLQKSMDFLLREGFWRKTPSGAITAEDLATITTNGISNSKIKKFHKKALKMAHKGIDQWPVHQRKASTVLITVNSKQLEDLRCLMDKFENELQEFIEKNSDGDEFLVQVTTHLTPVGGKL